jgi:hypothetical protein
MSSTGRFETKKVRPKNNPGRPRKNGKPARAQRASLPLKVRREIKRMLNDGATVAQIQLAYKRYRPTAGQIAGIKYGRVKLVSTPRTDADVSLDGTDTPIRTGKTVTELLDEQLLTTLEDMGTRGGILPGDRAFMLEKLSRVDRHIKSSRLESALGRRDAAVIAEIVRMYVPAATDEDVVQIYRQAVEMTKLKERDG